MISWQWNPIIWSLAAAGAWTLRYNLVEGAESGLQAGLAVSTALLTLVSLAPLLQRYIATHRHWLLAAVLIVAIWGGFLAGMAISEAGLRIGFPAEVAVPLLLVGYGVLLGVIQSWLLRRVEQLPCLRSYSNFDSYQEWIFKYSISPVPFVDVKIVCDPVHQV